VPTLKLRDLAGAIEARLEGDPEVSVSGVAPLERAGPGDLSFLANPRYEESALRSGAGALIVGESFHGNGRNLLRVANPYLAYARAVELLLPEAAAVPGIDSRAIIHASAHVGEDVSIGPFVVIDADAKILIRSAPAKTVSRAVSLAPVAAQPRMVVIGRLSPVRSKTGFPE